jgi:autophagy-related protein 5
MKMSKDDTTQLWHSVIDNDLPSFARINNHLLNAPTALKHIPLRIYIPSSPRTPTSPNPDPEAGSFKVLQTLVPATTPERRPQLLGLALRKMMPSLFPSSRDPVLANVIMHGAPVPFDAPLPELMREAAYPDGWLCLVVTV